MRAPTPAASRDFSYAATVSTKPGGTGSSARSISPRFAPLPPTMGRFARFTSARSTTSVSGGATGVVGGDATVGVSEGAMVVATFFTS